MLSNIAPEPFTTTPELEQLSNRLNKNLHNNTIVLDITTVGIQQIIDSFIILLGASTNSLQISGIKETTIIGNVINFIPINGGKLTTSIYGIPIDLASISFINEDNQISLKLSTVPQILSFSKLVNQKLIPPSDSTKAYPAFSLSEAQFNFNAGQSKIKTLNLYGKIANDVLNNLPFSFEDQSLNFNITAEDKLTSYSALIEGKLNKEIDVKLALPLGGSCWKLDVDTKKSQIITFSNFLSLFDKLFDKKVFNFKNILPKDLVNILDNITLKFLSMQFDSTFKLNLLSFTIGSSKPWPILKNVIEIDNNLSLSITLFNEEGKISYYGMITGSATLGGKIKVVISISLPIISGTSIIQSNSNISLGNSFENLISLMPGYNMEDVFPKGIFRSFTNLFLTNIKLEYKFFNPTGISRFIFKVQSSSPCTLPFNTTLSNMELDLDIRKDKSGKNYQTSAYAQGKFTFGSMGTEVDVALQKPIFDENWTLNAISENGILPSISEFMKFMTGKEKLDYLLPTNIDKISNLIISDLQIAFFGANLNKFSFNLSSDPSDSNLWEIIPGRLKLKDFLISFTFFNNGSKEKYGNIIGLLSIKENDFFISATYRDSKWTFVYKLENIDYSDNTSKIELVDLCTLININQNDLLSYLPKSLQSLFENLFLSNLELLYDTKNKSLSCPNFEVDLGKPLVINSLTTL